VALVSRGASVALAAIDMDIIVARGLFHITTNRPAASVTLAQGAGRRKPAVAAVRRGAPPRAKASAVKHVVARELSQGGPLVGLAMALQGAQAYGALTLNRRDRWRW
jgi:hypothetical protein